eukprot:5578699-Amphidinium_carterae.3
MVKKASPFTHAIHFDRSVVAFLSLRRTCQAGAGVSSISIVAAFSWDFSLFTGCFADCSCLHSTSPATSKSNKEKMSLTRTLRRSNTISSLPSPSCVNVSNYQFFSNPNDREAKASVL